MQNIYILYTGKRYVVTRTGQKEGYSPDLGKFNSHKMALECAQAYKSWEGGTVTDKTNTKKGV